MDNYKKVFNLHLPINLYEDLRNRAFREHRSITALIVEILEKAEKEFTQKDK